LISALPAEEIEELLFLGMINDRAWTIVACSAKEKEGMNFMFSRLFSKFFWKIFRNILSLTISFIGLQEGLNWLVQNVDV
jgi:hypothetical protein